MEAMQKKSFYSPVTSSFKILRNKRKTPNSMARCHYHNNYELYYLRSGKRYYFIKDKTYLVDAGTLVFIRKFDIHSTANYENEGYERILINFNDDFIMPLLSAIGEEDLFERFKGAAGIIKFTDENKDICEHLLMHMLEEYEKNNNNSSTYLKSLLLSLFMFIRAQKKDVPLPTESNVASRKAISDIAGYINNNYFENITLESISSKFYISPYYFSRSFKRITGFGFKEYLNNVRIKEAKKMLSSSKMNITDISSAVGYQSPTNFGRVFMKITGMSPTQYRIKVKKHQ